MLEVISSHHHDNRFNGVPPAMPGVPHHTIVCHGLVWPIIVMTVQIARVTPVRGKKRMKPSHCSCPESLKTLPDVPEWLF